MDKKRFDIKKNILVFFILCIIANTATNGAFAKNVYAQTEQVISAISGFDIGGLLKKLDGLFHPRRLSEKTYEQWLASPDIPEYSGVDFCEINGNIPFFTESERKSTQTFETYSELDALGRCGAAYANLGYELMPTQPREDISEVRPTGWHSVNYPSEVVFGGSLYNRSHLIAFALAGENANPKNLITGTSHFNQISMQQLEIPVMEYIRTSRSHVLYRVTPVFEGDDLIAKGVLMEAFSVEDGGTAICFNKFCYNVQPGVIIDYATGESHLEDGYVPAPAIPGDTTYVLNTNRMKFHRPDCTSVTEMNPANRRPVTWTREECVENGYSPCGKCKP